MKTLRFLTPIAILWIIASSLLVSGCTLIGLGIGAVSDATAAPDFVSVSSWQLDSISLDKGVSVFLNDGRLFHNATVRAIRDPLPAYQKRFEEFAAAHSDAFSGPEPMDSIVVTSVKGRSFPAVLLAYDCKTIWIKQESLPPLDISYPSLQSIEFKGTTWTRAELQDAVEITGIPVLSVIAIADKSSGAEHCVVSPSDINFIRYQESSHRWLTGLLIGAAIDAGILVSVAISQSSHGTSGHSCPFVYSYDGNEYVLDSETFTGAIFKALERTDCDNLEHLADRNGAARLRIANELPEIQYVDQVRILAVDHPAGTEIIPRSPENFCSISDPQMPTSATDLNGHVVTALVSGRDSLSWISNPAGRNPNDASSVRDGLVLQFRRPAGARQAKVAFALQNTPWAVEMEEQLLRLQGSNLNRWYEALNTSQNLREGFVEAVKREAMLSVQIWEGRSWKTVDYIPLVGPFAEKRQVVNVDLQGTPEDELRIRVESTAGLWMVNSVQADFTPDAPVQVTEAVLTSAIDAKGNDLRHLLRGIDGSYYILRNGDRAELAFSLPPKKPGLGRSYVLLSTGYYTIDVAAAGTPRYDLVRWIGNEQGAFGRYSTRLFNTWLDNQLVVHEGTVDSSASK